MIDWVPFTAKRLIAFRVSGEKVKISAAAASAYPIVDFFIDNSSLVLGYLSIMFFIGKFYT
jgi:hypothetical protein